MKRWNTGRFGVALAVVALLGVLVVPSLGAASASPSASASTTWAYGGDRWANDSGTAPGGNGSFTLREFLGVQVVLTQTNTSATTFELSANRTVVGIISAAYCRPNCQSPTESAFVSLRAWEVVDATANFTTASSVVGGSGAVPAVGIVNSSVRSSANVSERALVNVTGPLGVHTASFYLGVRASVQAAFQFSPALGLVPTNLSATPTWSSQSSYTGNGSGFLAYRATHTTFAGLTTTVGNSSRFSANASGTVSVQGSTLDPVRLDGGIDTTAVRLVVSGPFSVREGFMLLPSGADLFSAHGGWQSQSVGGQTAGTDAVDYRPSAGSHVGLEASTTVFAGSASDVTSASPLALGLPAASSGSTTLQAQPETAAQASGQGSCLLNSNCPPNGGPVGSRPALGGAILLAVAVVGLVVVVVGLLVARQPPRTDPPSPNANLYPQGAAAAPPPPGRPPAPARPDPEDPLGHLW
jgi:hypothetical protein